jgi:hypothetical protein
MNVTSEASRFLEGYGLVNASRSRCLNALTQVPDETAYRLPGGFERYDWLRFEPSIERTLEFLCEFTPPVVRHVLVELRPDWTLCLNNDLPNCSFANDAPSLAQRACALAFRIVDSPSRVWRRGSLKEVTSHEARIFEAYGPSGKQEKVILAMEDDGKWKWFNEGVRFPIEDSFNYNARKVKDRFTSDNLKRLIESLGAPIPAAEMLAACGSFALLKSPGEPNETFTREQLDDPAFGYYRCGMGYVPHIKTHASSVIACFERAMQINPAYESKMRGYLEQARQIMENGGG